MVALIISIISLLFGSGICVGVAKYIMGRVKANDIKTEAVCSGVQALLRDRLYQQYNKYDELGYAPIYAKENFANMYNQYHALGKNGVMDDIYRKFMELPLPPNEKE